MDHAKARRREEEVISRRDAEAQRCLLAAQRQYPLWCDVELPLMRRESIAAKRILSASLRLCAKSPPGLLLRAAASSHEQIPSPPPCLQRA